MCVYVASIVKNYIRNNIIQKVPANMLLIQLGVELQQFLVCHVPNVCYITAWVMPKVILHKILVGKYNIGTLARRFIFLTLLLYYYIIIIMLLFRIYI